MSEIQEEIDALKPWFHNLHLPDGSQTAPDHSLGDFPTFKWQQIAPFIPQDLTNWNVLDIGCNAGFYSFELAKRNGNVTAIDIDNHYLHQARWASYQYGLSSKIEFVKSQVYDLASWDKMYDLVCFMGVFYHLQYPSLALDIVTRKTKSMLVFQSLTIPGNETYVDKEDFELWNRELLLQPGWPRMAFIEHAIAGDPTNWWVPNHSAIVALLRKCGFRILYRPSHEVYICMRENEIISDDDLRALEYNAAIGYSHRKV